MSLPFDFRGHVYAFNSAGTTNISFLRWGGATQVIAGTVIDAGFVPLVISPAFVFVPRVPKDQIQRLPAGDRHRSGCLVWSLAVDYDGTTYDTLCGIDQAGHTRPDRIVDNDRGLTYVVETAWEYDRQGLVSGAIGLLLDSDNSQD